MDESSVPVGDTVRIPKTAPIELPPAAADLKTQPAAGKPRKRSHWRLAPKPRDLPDETKRTVISDTWQVRFPDGRVVRAPTTESLRQHLLAGNVPFASRVRRAADEEWTALEWTEEFADLIPAVTASAHSSSDRHPHLLTGEFANLASRLDPVRLRTVGLRGLLEELAAALDSAMSRPKLLVAGAVGVSAGVCVALAGSATRMLGWPGAAPIWLSAAILVFLVGVFALVLVTQMTYIELCRLRPARWKESRARCVSHSIRAGLSILVAAGAAGGGIVLLRWLPTQLATVTNDIGSEVLAHAAKASVEILALLMEVLIWPVAGFILLLAPIVVVEDCGPLAALWHWWGLIRRHLGRLFLYESTAVLIGMANVVFAVPLALACLGRGPAWDWFDSPTGLSLCVLAGLVAAPLLSYLAVAHVFIYLNVRYEVETSR